MLATLCGDAGRPASSDAATTELFAAASCALTRSACSDREEYWETTIAVEVAATRPKAAPSHQRTPRNRLVMSERLRREAPQGAHGFGKGARMGARALSAEDDMHVPELRQ